MVRIRVERTFLPFHLTVWDPMSCDSAYIGRYAVTSILSNIQLRERVSVVVNKVCEYHREDALMSREDVAVIVVTHSPMIGTTRDCLSAFRRRPTIQPFHARHT